MAKYRSDITYNNPVPQSWFDALMEYISTLDSNLRIELATATSIRIPASAGAGLVALGIGGPWRYNTANVTATHPGGAAGTYDVYAVASANSFTPGGPAGETDNTDYSFGLQIVTSGGTPTGNWNGNAITAYRKIGTVTWNGAAITAINPLLGAASTEAGMATNDVLLALAMNFAEGVHAGTSDNPQTALQVSPGSGLQVSAAAGWALVQGDDATNQGLYPHRSTGAITAAVSANATGNPRIDAVVLRINDPSFTTRAPSDSTFAGHLEVIAGNARSGATLANLDGAPGKTNGPTFPPSALLLGYVLVANGASSFVGGDIQDARKLSGPAIWGEDGFRYRIGIDSLGKLGTEKL